MSTAATLRLVGVAVILAVGACVGVKAVRTVSASVQAPTVTVMHSEPCKLGTTCE